MSREEYEAARAVALCVAPLMALLSACLLAAYVARPAAEAWLYRQLERRRKRRPAERGGSGGMGGIDADDAIANLRKAQSTGFTAAEFVAAWKAAGQREIDDDAAEEPRKGS